MNKTEGTKAKLLEFLSDEKRGSIYSFIVNFFSLTTLTILICLIMFMHKLHGASYSYWTIYNVGVALELGFVWLAVIDSFRKNPKERLFGSRMLNLSIFTITVTIIAALYWNTPEQIAIVYGAVCGGFAGYLAGGLAYSNFFVKVKDTIFRIVFGGWIGVSIGAIFGALFAGLINPLFEKVFAGIFMGFWGGAIVSGPIAVVLLVVLEKNISFRNFFSKLLVYDVYRKVKASTEEILVEAVNQDSKIITKYLTDFELLNVSEDIDETKESEDEPFWNRFLRIITKIIFLINPWEIETETIRVNAYRDIFALYFSEKYLKSLNQITKGIAFEKYQTESDTGSKLRETIIHSLECLPIERSKDMILHSLNDPSCDVTITAIKTIGNLKMKEAVPHLQVIQFGEFSGCWESKTNNTIAKKLMTNANNALAKIFEHPTTDLEKLAGKIIYTDKDSYDSTTDLIPDELILTQDDVIQLYHLLIDGYKKSQKMADVSRDQILDTVSYIAIRLPPEELKTFVKRLYKEGLKNLAKKIEKFEDVFV
ncbi:MAG: MFS transporter [Candidatus Heimdallarchaeota archaeon]|nr:MAG: MFS transporter [Candidatus Heimdallarchaeota archaeon]